MEEYRIVENLLIINKKQLIIFIYLFRKTKWLLLRIKYYQKSKYRHLNNF